jgi:hypothetical protein
VRLGGKRTWQRDRDRRPGRAGLRRDLFDQSRPASRDQRLGHPDRARNLSVAEPVVVGQRQQCTLAWVERVDRRRNPHRELALLEDADSVPVVRHAGQATPRAVGPG